MAFSEREQTVMGMLCEGKQDKEIARTLGVAPNTVRTYVRLVRAKLDVDTRAQAILKWERMRR